LIFLRFKDEKLFRDIFFGAIVQMSSGRLLVINESRKQDVPFANSRLVLHCLLLLNRLIVAF
jgi:hypothetical protein